MTKKIFSSGITFLGYKSNFQKSGGHMPPRPLVPTALGYDDMRRFRYLNLIIKKLIVCHTFQDIFALKLILLRRYYCNLKTEVFYDKSDRLSLAGHQI